MNNSLTNFKKELRTAKLASTLTNNARDRLGIASKNNTQAALNAANAAINANKAAINANKAAVNAVNATVNANAASMPGGKRHSKRVTVRRNKRKRGTKRN
jgi:hypothetical protein